MNGSNPSLLSNNVYNFLKFMATLLLPALGALYFGLSEVWGFPFPDEINGTINTVVLFIGVLMGYSSKSYRSSDDRFDADILVTKDDSGRKILQIEATNEQLDALVHEDREAVVFRIKTEE